MQRIRVIVHRGYGIGPLENTLHSIRTAVELGVDGVEIDVHASRDREIVVMHDFTLDRTTNGTGFLAQRTLAELKQLKIGGSEPIPTLQEVIDEVIDQDNLLLNIEVKPSKIEQQVLEIIERNGISDRVIISSYVYSILRTVREFDSNIVTGLIYDYTLKNPVQIARELGATALHPHVSFVSTQLVEQCRQQNLLINPFVVNEKQELLRMIDLAVNAIITDYPTRLLKLLKS